MKLVRNAISNACADMSRLTATVFGRLEFALSCPVTRLAFTAMLWKMPPSCDNDGSMTDTRNPANAQKVKYGTQ